MAKRRKTCSAFKNLIDYALGNAQLSTKFVNRQVGYWTIRTDILHSKHFGFTRFSHVQPFTCSGSLKLCHYGSVREERARKCLAKDIRSKWTSELDIETLESHRIWVTLAEVQSVIPFSHLYD